MQALTDPYGCRQLAYASGKLVISMHWRPLPLGDIPATHFCLRLSHPQGQRAARRFKSMNNPSYSIGNQISNHLVCRTIPQPALPPHIPIQSLEHLAIHVISIHCLTYLHTYQTLLSQSFYNENSMYLKLWTSF
jgi:hypothetical protein